MTTTTTNMSEAARATLDYYRTRTESTGNNLQESIVDLLTDLRHLLLEEGIDIQRVLSLARLHEQAEHSAKYQGCSNYQTWAVNLWLNNDQATYNACRELAEECRHEATEDPRVADGVWNAEEAARFTLADRLRDLVEEGSPLAEATMYSDLLSAALQEVDWQEIADEFHHES